MYSRLTWSQKLNISVTVMNDCEKACWKQQLCLTSSLGSFDIQHYYRHFIELNCSIWNHFNIHASVALDLTPHPPWLYKTADKWLRALFWKVGWRVLTGELFIISKALWQHPNWLQVAFSGQHSIVQQYSWRDCAGRQTHWVGETFMSVCNRVICCMVISIRCF